MKEGTTIHCETSRKKMGTPTRRENGRIDDNFCCRHYTVEKGGIKQVKEKNQKFSCEKFSFGV
ncbi:MAG: hypothetical protein HUK22_05210 [Thermoguttaceae bacterium]|nr:hypothetical protein [Thermoguttaceae bacterium]